jgi:hypothetical protein
MDYGKNKRKAELGLLNDEMSMKGQRDIHEDSLRHAEKEIRRNILD